MKYSENEETELLEFASTMVPQTDAEWNGVAKLLKTNRTGKAIKSKLANMAYYQSNISIERRTKAYSLYKYLKAPVNIEETPIEETTPIEESTPIEEFIPIEEPTPIEESTPIEEPTPIEEFIPIEEPTPIEEVRLPRKDARLPRKETRPPRSIIRKHSFIRTYTPPTHNKPIDMNYFYARQEEYYRNIIPSQSIPTIEQLMERQMVYYNNINYHTTGPWYR